MPRKIDAMHTVYGYGNGFCGQCKHFVRTMPTDRSYFKCRAYGVTACEATDWRAKWVACGLYNQPLPVPFRPLIEAQKHAKRKESDKPIEGQINIDLEGRK